MRSPTTWRRTGRTAGRAIASSSAPAASRRCSSTTPSSRRCHARGFTIAIETNGTLPLPAGIDWICVSPKSDAELVVTRGDELKLVYPQPRAMPERFVDLAFEHFLIQPMDGLPGDPTARRRGTPSAP